MGAKPDHPGSCLPRRARRGLPRLAGEQALPPSLMAWMAHGLQVNRPLQLHPQSSTAMQLPRLRGPAFPPGAASCEQMPTMSSAQQAGCGMAGSCLGSCPDAAGALLQLPRRRRLHASCSVREQPCRNCTSGLVTMAATPVSVQAAPRCAVSMGRPTRVLLTPDPNLQSQPVPHCADQHPVNNANVI